MARFHAGIYPDTKAMEAFASRELSRAIMWAPGRMVDKAEDMLLSYQKNANQTGDEPVVPGKGALFPAIVVAMSDDYSPTPADFGGRQLGRQLVALEERDGASVYGYRQAMGEVRTQVAIFAAEAHTARSMAAQFCLFVGEMSNRRFRYAYKWGQYTLSMPVTLETPDIMFSEVETSNAGMKVLVADLNLRAVFPYLDAPREGEENDGTDNVPPGYPTVVQIDCINTITGEVQVVAINDSEGDAP